MPKEPVTKEEFDAARAQLRTFGLYERMTVELLMTYIEQGIRRLDSLHQLDRDTIDNLMEENRELRRELARRPEVERNDVR